jgi:murein L,D-transpeptidase YafK
MTRIFRLVLILSVGFGLAACSSKFRTYTGPQVTAIQVHKSERKMYLLHNDEVLETYDIALGFGPIGHKQVEGDGKTPEGLYYITHRNPKSSFYLSLGISYPNDADRAAAKALGKPPGGDIFIHGGPRGPITQADWTAGCISVTDRQMEVVYSMVKPGTPIWILE